MIAQPRVLSLPLFALFDSGAVLLLLLQLQLLTDVVVAPCIGATLLVPLRLAFRRSYTLAGNEFLQNKLFYSIMSQVARSPDMSIAGHNSTASLL